jgi:hypothetical protein
VVLGTAFTGIFHANSAAQTGPAFVLEATALGRGRDLRAYFSGQNLVLCVIGAPLVVAVCSALTAGPAIPAWESIVGACWLPTGRTRSGSG